MYQGKTYTLFARYAIPQMIGLLFNSIYLIVDGIFIGNRLGRDALAAASVSVPLIEMLISVSVAIASGAGVLISNQFGRKKNEDAVKTFNTAVRILAIIGAGIAIGGSIFIYPLARGLGATSEIMAQVITYMRYIMIFAPFLLFSFLLGGLARNDGQPKLAMFALTFGSISNIVLDFVFIYPFNMGIGGAALATALGPVFSVLILLPHFVFKRGNLHFSRQKLYRKEIKKILTLGLPSFIMEFTIGMVTFVYNSAITRYGYGEVGLAAYLTIGYLMLIILTLFLGMAEGLQPVFSYFSGKGEDKKNQDLKTFAAKVFIGIGLISYVLIVLFAKNFYLIFTPYDLELTIFSYEKSILYFFLFFLAGYNILMISFWQSIQETRQALTISLSRSIVVPPVLITALPLIFGREIMWLCHSLSEAVTTCIVLVFLIKAKQRGQ